jgi:hypothetical protein
MLSPENSMINTKTVDSKLEWANGGGSGSGDGGSKEVRREEDGSPSQICFPLWLNSLPIYSPLILPIK